MSIASQITRIQTDRNTIRNKLVELGLATNVDNLDVLAQAVDGIENKGSVSANVKEGETYTIPKGYHDGSGTVSGVAGGGNYTLQSKTNITPTKKSQQITPDSGYYGLSDVTINAIPDAYQDVTSVTAAAGDVLTGKVIVSNTGVVTAGTMSNNGAVNKTLTTSEASYTVPGGYHNGSGTVNIVPEDKTVTPTKSAQDITATTGKVLNKVSVAAIPDAYQDVTEVTAEAVHVLAGKKIVSSTGAVVTGSMLNHGAKTLAITPNDVAHALPDPDVYQEAGYQYAVPIPHGYHDGNGYIGLATSSIDVVPDKGGALFSSEETGTFYDFITIAPIPDEYQDVTEVTAEAAHVLAGKKIVSSTGAVVTGSMANNGDVSATIDGLTTMSVTIPAGYTTGGTVSLTSDVEEALAAI